MAGGGTTTEPGALSRKRPSESSAEGSGSDDPTSTKIPRVSESGRRQQQEGGEVIVKGAWSTEEDQQMLRAVEEFGTDWKAVATRVKGRTSKQCRDRYKLKLDPNINHGAWSPEEDQILLQFHQDLGRQWTKIAKLMKGRTENSVKSRFASLQRAKKREWTEEEDLLLRQCMARNLKYEQVATQFMNKRSAHAIQKRWERLFMRDLAEKIRDELPTSNDGTTPSGAQPHHRPLGQRAPSNVYNQQQDHAHHHMHRQQQHSQPMPPQHQHHHQQPHMQQPHFTQPHNDYHVPHQDPRSSARETYPAPEYGQGMPPPQLRPQVNGTYGQPALSPLSSPPMSPPNTSLPSLSGAPSSTASDSGVGEVLDSLLEHGEAADLPKLKKRLTGEVVSPPPVGAAPGLLMPTVRSDHPYGFLSSGPTEAAPPRVSRRSGNLKRQTTSVTILQQILPEPLP